MSAAEIPPDPPRPDDVPSTEEALPGVDLEPDEEDEQRARETLGPEAADDEPDGEDAG